MLPAEDVYMRSAIAALIPPVHSKGDAVAVVTGPQRTGVIWPMIMHFLSAPGCTCHAQLAPVRVRILDGRCINTVKASNTASYSYGRQLQPRQGFRLAVVTLALSLLMHKNSPHIASLNTGRRYSIGGHAFYSTSRVAGFSVKWAITDQLFSTFMLVLTRRTWLRLHAQ